jgi:hypothetical protein
MCTEFYGALRWNANQHVFAPKEKKGWVRQKKSVCDYFCELRKIEYGQSTHMCFCTLLASFALGDAECQQL